MYSLLSNAHLWAFFLILLLASCKTDKKEEAEDQDVVTVVTELMEFQAPDTIPSGWTTFIYKNMSKEPHFFVLERMPEGKRLEDSKREVVPVFQEGMDSLNAGNPEGAMAVFGKLPPWFAEVKMVGGSGLISPGGVSETTVKMEPGYYLMECYVKMKGGIFHSVQGMMKGLTVLEEDSGNEEPEPTAEVSIGFEQGIVFEDTLEAGEHVIRVNFKDQRAHENFVGHDVHIVRLIGNSQQVKDDLNKWMDWTHPEGLINPAPDSIEFLGGSQEMDSLGVAYFKVDLKPGNYALISEVPRPAEKKMFPVFVVE